MCIRSIFLASHNSVKHKFINLIIIFFSYLIINGCTSISDGSSSFFTGIGVIKNNNLENKYLDLNIRFVVSDTSGLGIKRTENELSKEYTDLLARAKDKGISYCKNNNLIFKETNIFSSRNDLSEPLSVSPYCLAKKKDYYDSCLRGGYEFHYTAYFLHFDCISADENQLSQGDLLHTEAERDKEFYKKLEEDKIKDKSRPQGNYGTPQNGKKEVPKNKRLVF